MYDQLAEDPVIPAKNVTCQSLASGQSATGSLSDLFKRLAKSAKMTFQWDQGLGSTSYGFGPGSVQASEMMQSPSVRQNIKTFFSPPKGPADYRGNASANRSKGLLPWFAQFVNGATQDFKGNTKFGDADQQRAAGNFNFGASVAAKGWTLTQGQALAGLGALISNSKAQASYASLGAASIYQGGVGGNPPTWDMGPGFPLLPPGPTQNQRDQQAWYEDQSIILGYFWYLSGCH